MNSDWVVAVIAAASALLGSGITGWFSRGAGVRQAEAAAKAGSEQAQALIQTVSETLAEQRRQQSWTVRRDVYAQFLAAASGGTIDETTSSGLMAVSTRRSVFSESEIRRAFQLVRLEGPDEAAARARELTNLLLRHMPEINQRPGIPSGTARELSAAMEAFVHAARRALGR
ncbi:hypothetical protein ABZY06_28645 [Streptomyces sp. NPDC006540]|uniref:hypothetical protein n=1 Tax=Streptomyces sp. NPDC006540 TaxID=3155353 RepID=UPI0033A651D3